MTRVLAEVWWWYSVVKADCAVAHWEVQTPSGGW